ncbi:hypothetical protein CEXT_579811 [Caerostris extrusa]|uniref:Uncharacterized protein n=1 Tax=Caerostris extrusa TaxID=172846 RepID=A0AAV4XGY3_CAEEX|nr:hypothetical protein CEXT_579811 [Caerostris extrusa]
MTEIIIKEGTNSIFTPFLPMAFKIPQIPVDQAPSPIAATPFHQKTTLFLPPSTSSVFAAHQRMELLTSKTLGVNPGETSREPFLPRLVPRSTRSGHCPMP